MKQEDNEIRPNQKPQDASETGSVQNGESMVDIENGNSGQRLEKGADDESNRMGTENHSAAEASDDDMATAEDLEAFLKDRRSKKEERKSQREEETDVFGEYRAPESSIDPYLEPDPYIPWVKHNENEFLSRGCNHCPQSYVPVNEMEMASCSKVTSYNWLRGIRQPCDTPFDVVEVRFKNNRKDFYRIPDGISVAQGDIVAVEGMPGHDVGIVTLVGEICRIQMKKKKVDPLSGDIKKLFRRAKANDIERWAESLKEEHSALLQTRRIAADLGLEMKVNDVEFQGDHSKATFYYTADDRVDFRNLIKVLAEQFKVRIEMKQIGVRQEAGKVGGLGTCGRELCCSTWLTNFKSVTTNAAKTQQILPNPQKLAGQCGKLKCCLNFEYAVYADALKNFPPANTPIRFQKGLALYKKTDVFRGIMWYAYEGESELYAIPAERVKQIIEMNRNQEYPEKLEDFQVELMSTSGLAQESSSEDFEQELSRLADKVSTEVLGGEQRKNERPERNNAKNHHKGDHGREQNPNASGTQSRRESLNEAKGGRSRGQNQNPAGGVPRQDSKGRPPRRDHAGGNGHQE